MSAYAASATLAQPQPTQRLVLDQSQHLTRHLRQCHEALGPWFGLRRVARRAHAVLAPRMVSTLAVGTLLIITTCAWV